MEGYIIAFFVAVVMWTIAPNGPEKPSKGGKDLTREQIEMLKRMK